jgi:hypothetical protein
LILGSLLLLSASPVLGQSCPVGEYAVPSPPAQVAEFHLKWLRAKAEYFKGHAQDFPKVIAALHYNSPPQPQDYSGLLREASDLARQSLTSNIRGISIDDFMTWYLAIRQEHREDAFPTLLDAIYSINPALEFSITIYHDQLPPGPRGYSTSMIPMEWRRRIRTVYLYLHSRPEQANTAKYASIAQREFPSSKIVLGVYNYDRRKDELGYHASHSLEREMDLFSDQLRNACALVAKGRATGVEFFPGALGEEDQYLASQPDQAAAAKQMRALALPIVKNCCGRSRKR